MGLNIHATGVEAGPATVRWDARDVMLYALGVGAGQADALKELEFTTENTEGVTLQVLPTFALVIAQAAGLRPDIGPYDRSRMVHAEQSLTLHGPLPIESEARVMVRVVSIEDKGSGALVTSVSEATNMLDGRALFTSRAAIFIRGEGGFHPQRKPSGAKPAWPERAPDIDVPVPTRRDQALLYRLCADRNPLHSDPAFAARGGFSRPILHGLATYGIAVRALLNVAAPGQAGRLRTVSGRFTKPVLPGEGLRVQAWRDEASGLRFRTLDDSGATVIDAGLLTLE